VHSERQYRGEKKFRGKGGGSLNGDEGVKVSNDKLSICGTGGGRCYFWGHGKKRMEVQVCSYTKPMSPVVTGTGL